MGRVLSNAKLEYIIAGVICTHCGRSGEGEGCRIFTVFKLNFFKIIEEKKSNVVYWQSITEF
jgi:hypothetical protein